MAHFPIFAPSTALRSCRPAAVQPPSSSSLQLSGRVAAVVVADCFDRSLRYPPYAATSHCCCCYCCSCQGQVTCRRKLEGSFEYHISKQTFLIFMSRLACFVRIHFPILAQSTTLRSYGPAAVQPRSSSSLQLSARVLAVAVADCFDRSLRCSTRLYALPLAAAATAAPVQCQVTCRRKV